MVRRVLHEPGVRVQPRETLHDDLHDVRGLREQERRAAFDHTEALETEVEKIPGGFRVPRPHAKRRRPASYAADAAATSSPGTAPATQRLANAARLVDFCRTLGPGQDPRSYGRDGAAERKADEITNLDGPRLCNLNVRFTRAA